MEKSAQTSYLCNWHILYLSPSYTTSGIANFFCRQIPAIVPFLANGNKKYYFSGKFPLEDSILDESNRDTKFNKVISILKWCHYKTCKQQQEQAATQNSAKEEPAAHSTRQIFNSRWIFLHLHCLSNSQAWWPQLHKKCAEHRSFTTVWHRTTVLNRMIACVVLSNSGQDTPFTQNSTQNLFFNCQTVSKLRVSLAPRSNTNDSF